MEYAELLVAAKRNPAAANFTALRLACAQSPEYAPYAIEYVHAKTWASLQKALSDDNIRTGNVQAAITPIHRMLATCYLDVQLHVTAATVYKMLADETQSIFHYTFAAGLLDSIFRSGDARSYETAFTVIDVREEYAVLRALDVELTRQTLVGHNDHWFDVLEVHNPQTGKPAAVKLYFNIDFLNDWQAQNPDWLFNGSLMERYRLSVKNSGGRKRRKKDFDRWPPRLQEGVGGQTFYVPRVSPS